MHSTDAQAALIDVVIPAQNHEGSIAALIGEVPRGLVRSVIVVAAASTDRTARVAEDAGAVVIREPTLGIGAACLRAVAHLTTLPKPPDVVVFLSADGSDDPAEIPALVKPLGGQLFDMALGSRALGHGRWPNPADLVAVNLIHALYGHRYTDLGRMRAVRYPALIALGLADTGNGFFVEMQVKAVRLGLRIAEVPVRERTAVVEGGYGEGLRGKLDAGSRALYAILRHATAR